MAVFAEQTTGLMIVDVQEKLLPLVERSEEIIVGMQLMIEAAKLIGLPIVVTEQYPKGLGKTVGPIKSMLPDDQLYIAKTAFSGWQEPAVREHVRDLGRPQWLLVGIETHVCVLQTARDMQAAGMDVAVINDAVSSRSIFDFSSAIAELRDLGVRLPSVETMIFELVADSTHQQFKAISRLLK